VTKKAATEIINQFATSSPPSTTSSSSSDDFWTLKWLKVFGFAWLYGFWHTHHDAAAKKMQANC